MTLRARALIGNVFDGKGDLAKLATFGAWLFALGSLIPLLWIMLEGGTGAVFKADVAGRAHTVPLLAYSGAAGVLLLWAQVLTVAGAFILTAAPRVPIKLARIGHGVLVGWSLLWTFGVWRLGMLAPGFWTLQALFLTVLCACTCWRAWVNWSAVVHTPRHSDSAGVNYFSDAAPCTTQQHDDTGASTRQQIAMAMEQARVAAIAAGRKIVSGVRAGIAAARNHDART